MTTSWEIIHTIYMAADLFNDKRIMNPTIVFIANFFLNNKVIYAFNRN